MSLIKSVTDYFVTDYIGMSLRSDIRVPVRLLALMCASVDACFLDKHIFLSMQATCWSSSLRGRALILVVRVCVCVCGIRGLVQAGSQRGLFGMF